MNTRNHLAAAGHAGLVWVVKLVFAPILWCVGPFRSRAAHRIPRRNGLLIVANHLSNLDPVLIQCACPRPICYMAKEELFARPILGPLIRLARAFPVKQRSADRRAIKTAIKLLDEGEAVLVFAEGQVNRGSDKLLPFLKGVALIAKQANCEVITCAINGSGDIWPKESCWPVKRHPIRILWGDAIRYPDSKTNDEIVDDLFRRVQGLGQL